LLDYSSSECDLEKEVSAGERLVSTPLLAAKTGRGFRMPRGKGHKESNMRNLGTMGFALGRHGRVGIRSVPRAWGKQREGARTGIGGLFWGGADWGSQPKT